MEKTNVHQGSVVLIHRHNPIQHNLTEISEEDSNSHCPGNYEEDEPEQTTIGVVWPLDKIEPNGIGMVNWD